MRTTDALGMSGDRKGNIDVFKNIVLSKLQDWWEGSDDCFTFKTNEREGGNGLDVLKYILFSVADGLSEDIIASREISEYADEIEVTYYRNESVTPVEVLEGLNMGEVPEEKRMEIKMRLAEEARKDRARGERERKRMEEVALKSR